MDICGNFSFEVIRVWNPFWDSPLADLCTYSRQHFWTVWVSRSGFHGFGTHGWRVTSEGSDQHPMVVHKNCWVCNRKVPMINLCYNIWSWADRYSLKGFCRIGWDMLISSFRSHFDPRCASIYNHPIHHELIICTCSLGHGRRSGSALSVSGWFTQSMPYPAQKEELFKNVGVSKLLCPVAHGDQHCSVTTSFEFQFWFVSLLFVWSFE